MKCYFLSRGTKYHICSVWERHWLLLSSYLSKFLMNRSIEEKNRLYLSFCVSLNAFFSRYHLKIQWLPSWHESELIECEFWK
ncbi:unnamed protein product [Blepharisma stoltei]|uniref:Uncharacterized protein n=1 Tax=Blepharisma stoltei TaxID=1481888 RepID=A0AAU9K4B4_9CILI|nr:unnamed protein product [Blepharisma stoltei]